MADEQNSSESVKKDRHRYANARAIEIAAAVNGLYKFNTVEQAAKKLDAIRRNFIIAREQEETKLPSLILWLREYEVSEEEQALGYVGHFAQLTVEEVADELFTIVATKLDKPLKNHPVRKRPPARTPNFGHPILRSVLKNKRYDTLEAAQAALQALQLEFPETTIPAVNKLFLMIFSRRQDPANPMKKYVLEIKNLQGGGFTLLLKENHHKALEKRPAVEDANDPIPKPLGHFASMVKLKRKK